MSTQPVSAAGNEMPRNTEQALGNGMQSDEIGRTHSTWTGLFKRCFNPIDRNFADYGGRGITVCERWFSFEVFVADMGLRPDGKTLDRIDNNGNYEPGNCRWATRQEQARNTRRNRVVLVNGLPKFQTEIAKEYGLCDSTISRRRAAGNNLTAEAFFKRNKLNKDEVAEIKALLSRGFKRRDIAERYAITVQMVGVIARGEAWGDVE
ncbi:hypothetical protein D3C87_820770 [compost metagenome]